MLASQLVFIGFESPSQFAEETRKADRTVPQAIVWSIIACGILGGGLVLVLLFCIQVRPHNSICKLKGTLACYSRRHGSERTSSSLHLNRPLAMLSWPALHSNQLGTGDAVAAV